MKAAAVLAVLAVLVLAPPASAHASRSSRVTALRQTEHRQVVRIEQAKTTLRWFENAKHAHLLNARDVRVKRRAWHAVALARARIIRTRVALARTRAEIKRLVPVTVYDRAHAEALRNGVTAYEWSACLVPLISRENGEQPGSWNPAKWNGQGSGAYGLPQALPGSKMASEGRDWATNPATQVRWMIGYARSRYGGVCSADSYQRRNNYY